MLAVFAFLTFLNGHAMPTPPAMKAGMIMQTSAELQQQNTIVSQLQHRLAELNEEKSQLPVLKQTAKLFGKAREEKIRQKEVKLESDLNQVRIDLKVASARRGQLAESLRQLNDNQ